MAPRRSATRDERRRRRRRRVSSARTGSARDATDDRQSRGQLPPAGHRQDRAGHAGDEVEQDAERRHAGPGPHERPQPGGAAGVDDQPQRGVAGARHLATGTTASTVTATSAYSASTAPRASGIARGIVRAGSRTSSPSVAIRA